MKYCIGVDLGTSSVKVLLINQLGEICGEVSKIYPLIQDKPGFSEQNPEEWVDKTVEALQELLMVSKLAPDLIEGISFSGQMHGLVLLDEQNSPVRNAILWNDTRTTAQCEKINQLVGRTTLLAITKNPALEGFTLPKILWVKEYEPHIFERAALFLLPKDYLRYRLTGQLQSEYSDAAGTLLLDIAKKQWSKEICEVVGVDMRLCPPLVESHHCVGTITQEMAKQTGLSSATKVFAGGADNACGAIGAGILEDGKTLCSIGTSGVLLSYEDSGSRDFHGKVHYFNHGKNDAYYSMGVTLAAGFALSWFKETFAEHENFSDLIDGIEEVPVGANGLLFTPYIVGERTPHADAQIRASFIGMDSTHKRIDFVRAVIEGITFSLNETIEIFRDSGKVIDTIVSIGGGAKNDTWLQIQADVFNAKIHKLASEQGPGIGAAIIAAYGCGWYSSLQECANHFTQTVKTFVPIAENVEKYKKLFSLYQLIYQLTKDLNKELYIYRQ